MPSEVPKRLLSCADGYRTPAGAYEQVVSLLKGLGSMSVAAALVKKIRSLVGVSLQSTYRALPLSIYYKRQLKAFCFKRFSFVFQGTQAYRNWQLFNHLVQDQLKSPVADLQQQTDLNEPLALPTTDDPVVSIIIPVYGQMDYTHRCLTSIGAHPIRTSYEVIVVDDCSPDATQEMLNRVTGVRMVTNEQNLGFNKSCNAGARAARGQYVLFLNNDTQVMPGWLDELVDTFAAHPEAGLVGSKLVYPNGTLQEAGCIVWQDGSAWNYGRNGDPNHPEFNYLREVDYCSGASIMVPRDLFQDLGGFDLLFAPAYCEDSDLAFRIRALGRTVLYQPCSTVVHYEGISSGTDVTEGVKAYQVENMKKFYQRWQEVIAAYRPGGGAPHLEKERQVTRRVLVLDHCTPTPDRDAGSQFTIQLMKIFQMLDFKVTFIPEDNFLQMERYTADLQKIGIECLYAPYTTSLQQHLKESGELYDIVVIFRVTAATRDLPVVRQYCPQANVIFHPADLHFLRETRQAALQQSDQLAAQALETKQKELHIVRSVDRVMVHSSYEKQVLSEYVEPDRVVVVPWVVEAPGSAAPLEERRDLIYIGGYGHPPNVDAVLYFTRQIFPLIKSRLPEAKFYIVGSNLPPELEALNSPDLIVTGYVEALEPLLDRMRMSVVPLRFGAGIKGKIGTSLSVGLPCVATSIAAEGLPLRPGRDILIADEPETFADLVVKLYEDDALWHHVSESGIAHVQQYYSFAAGADIVSSMLTSLKLASAKTP